MTDRALTELIQFKVSKVEKKRIVSIMHRENFVQVAAFARKALLDRCDEIQANK